MTGLIETPLGNVEIMRGGGGPPVLFVHGTPGGSDTSWAMGQFLVDAGLTVIAPSRPGYLGTELGENKTIDQQADLLAALMTTLGFEKFSVVAWSGGGPSSYRLAVKYPDRVNALVPFACVSGKYAEPKENLETKLIFRTSFGHWLMHFLAQHAPESTIKSTLGEEGDLSRAELKRQATEVIGDEQQAAVPLALAEVVADFDNRTVGFDNDWAQFEAIDSLELEKVTAPTLVVYGDADADVDPVQSANAVAAVPGAEEYVIEKGTHLALFAHPDAHVAQARVLEFLFAHGAGHQPS
ncbi:MAG: alpha/beta hydrolase [Thermoleophilaceae bacterium]|nr:alpha/beta hydrolase [Thermoleophilaceae bacterium]